MKKRFLALILLLAMMMMCCGCDNSTIATKLSSCSEIDVRFTRIAGYDLLVYDNETQIVYYLFSITPGNQLGFGYMSPYISENGNFCRYSDGQIVEIVK